MELRHARTFVTVADLGTVSKAALQLRVAQPALSRQISDLEHELGLKLFDRVGRRLVITSEGQQLLADCRALLACAAAIGERALELHAGDAGDLKVAGGPQFIEGALADFLRAYGRRYPKVKVTVIEASSWVEGATLLERGDIHLWQNLLRAVPADEHKFGRLRLASVDLLAACRANDLLGAAGVVDIAKLVAHPLLVLDTNSMFRRSFDAACRLAGLTPTIAYESRTPMTLLAMAESGHGVAILPSTMRLARHPLYVSAITFRRKPLQEPLAIYWNARRPLPRYATAFCEMLAEYTRKTFPISRATASPRLRRRGM